MDHVPYTHGLHSGKTVIQHIYESRYKGAAAAASYVQQWKSRVTRIDEHCYRELLARLEYQAGHAEVSRCRQQSVSSHLRHSKPQGAGWG